jgi:3-phenylpropionate/cinnamic acid dioxygenase small subunit
MERIDGAAVTHQPTEQELARFIRHEARLIDEKRFDEWLALFTEDARYWVPATPGQTDPLHHNSLAYEDRLLLELRIERLKSPRAYSQRPPSRCLHVLQEPEPEKLDYERGEFLVRTPFLYTETRGDESQRYAATAWHTLVGVDGRLRIRLKRVDLLNCDAALPSIQLFL